MSKLLRYALALIGLAMSFTVLVSANDKLLATKQHFCDEYGKTTTTDYGKGYLWFVKRIPFLCFEGMARALEALLDQPREMVICGEPKPSLDLAKPVRRKMREPEAAFDDVPRQWLHADIDNIAAEHLDIIADPGSAIRHVLAIVTRYAPELTGVSVFCSFSSSAGVYDVVRAKMHLWWWLDRLYSNAEKIRWAKQVNSRAGFKLIDPAVFNAVQPNYTARPIFVGRADPLGGARRYATVRGETDAAKLWIDDDTPSLERSTTRNVDETHWGGGFDRHLADIGGERGLFEPARAAVAARVAALGAERASLDRETILSVVTNALRSAPRGHRSVETVEQYVSDIVRFFDWVMDRQRQSEAARPAVSFEDSPTRFPLDEARERLKVMTRNTIAALLPENSPS